MEDPLALRFASTLRAGRGGLKDALATPEAAAVWLAEHVPGAGPADHSGLAAL
ncbi:ABATE domain-containing protein, partial [Actinocorallia lasiicapitis]